MFIRPHYRTKNGKRHAYWALMESYRTERGPRQRVVAYLGQLDEAHRLGMHEAAAGTAGMHQKRFFDDTRPAWVEVDVKRVRVENRRAFGGAWLGLELIGALGLKEFLAATMPRGDEDVPWSLMVLVLMLCRLCEPSSELHISEHIYAHSALADLLGIPPEKINEQRHLVAQVQFLATHELVARGHIALGDHEFLGPAGKRVFIKAHQRVLLVQQFPGAGAVTETRTGTFVNGRRVRSAEIHPGDILAVGRSEFVVRFEPVSAAFAMAAGHAGACR